jgi:hypothetical protein
MYGRNDSPSEHDLLISAFRLFELYLNFPVDMGEATFWIVETDDAPPYIEVRTDEGVITRFSIGPAGRVGLMGN